MSLSLNAAQLTSHGLVCPIGGIDACDNGGACGLCLQLVPASLYNDCPYGGALPHCRPGQVEFGGYCEGGGGHTFQQYECGTHKGANTCFGGFDTYVNVFCDGTSPQEPPPPPPPPRPPSAPPRLPPTPPAAPPPTASRPAPPPRPPLWPPPSLSVVSVLKRAVSTRDLILIAAGIPLSLFLLFGLAVGRYYALQRRQRSRDLARQRAHDAKVELLLVEYNAAVSLAVKSLPTREHAASTTATAPTDDGVELAAVRVQNGAAPAPASGSLDALTSDVDSAAVDCAVCMGPFVAGERLKDLPCQHSFHAACIDAWLLGKGRAPPSRTSPHPGPPACPLCKAVPIEVPPPKIPPMEQPPAIRSRSRAPVEPVSV